MRHLKPILGLPVLLLLLLGMSMNACGWGDSASWQEEVLLHDGDTIIVERAQVYGGYSTLESRERMLVKETWEFIIPGTKQSVLWKNDYGKTPEKSNLMLLLLDFKYGTPYLATSPAGCISYNIWKRPNPPYVFFKYDGKKWQQISQNEFPVEFTNSNVAVGRPDPNHRTGLLGIDTINEENRLLEPYLRQILREPLKPGSPGVSCEELVRIPGGWLSPDWFTSKPNLEACLQFCESRKIQPQDCPCKNYFNQHGERCFKLCKISVLIVPPWLSRG